MFKSVLKPWENQRASLKIDDRVNATHSHLLVVSFMWISSKNCSVSRTHGLKLESFSCKHSPMMQQACVKDVSS